ncbi:DNA replication complex GINS protein SLD5 [Cryptosporidium felis]|nr:DNA replication complex GINS protein SLD5 [Cryptosporidium felis]
MNYAEEEDEHFSDKENSEKNAIFQTDLNYIDHLYSSKHFTDESQISELKKAEEVLFSAWINELVSPELLTYCASPIQTVCYSIYKEKQKQITRESEKGLRDIVDRIEQDLTNIRICRSAAVLKMYLKQRMMKISEFPDFSIANSSLPQDEGQAPNISQEEAIFALKLSKLQWKYLDSVISKMKNTLATDSSVPIPSPPFFRIVRFQCLDSIGKVKLVGDSPENPSFTQLDEQDGFSQYDSEKVINIEKGKTYVCKYEDLRTLLDQSSVQLWPWPPIISNNYSS